MLTCSISQLLPVQRGRNLLFTRPAQKLFAAVQHDLERKVGVAQPLQPVLLYVQVWSTHECYQ